MFTNHSNDIRSIFTVHVTHSESRAIHELEVARSIQGAQCRAARRRDRTEGLTSGLVGCLD
jgi:hypothetical protein